MYVLSGLYLPRRSEKKAPPSRVGMRIWTRRGIWHLALLACVFHLDSRVKKDGRTERGRGMASPTGLGAGRKGKGEDGTAFFDAAPPCQTRGVGRRN